MYCNNCGIEIADNYKFCAYCGAFVESQSNIDAAGRLVHTCQAYRLYLLLNL